MVVITVGGPPGSGTSTLCELLRERTGYRYVYAGQIFRQLAKDRRMSLVEFGELCEEDPAVDMELDGMMMDLARSGEDLILEGRMTGPLCKRFEIQSFKVYLDADPGKRALRVMERDGGDLNEVILKMAERETSEARRYLEYYSIDPRDLSHYDLIIDSTDMTPEKELEHLLRGMEGGP